ncbi:MAG: helix-turn-helix domain-containing protein [Candidatus Peribacteria bacterium]|nr:helix-turn-helix domain-containing protein [Candidatus Peribacteria bacterium]
MNIGYSIPSIAKKINRHKSTLYRMLKNNGIEYKKSRYRYIG